ncbi:hypothetical protein [Streptomyces sp. NRRL F-5135]|uniref:hypothetical protein n=1 Tax=Streptomyces sp. NRRL F-5135 TaxID=1463858 RepID=UPI0004C6B6A6|nr:hypothetical protein [Streptomyces sp. NRRL F-5135]
MRTTSLAVASAALAFFAALVTAPAATAQQEPQTPQAPVTADLGWGTASLSQYADTDDLGWG